jgi:hypothetical protein
VIVEGGLQKGSISICGSSVRGTWSGCSFAGDPEGYRKGGSGGGPLSPWGPRWGAWKGAYILGTYVLTKSLERGISLHRSPVGNHGGSGLCTGNSER